MKILRSTLLIGLLLALLTFFFSHCQRKSTSSSDQLTEKSVTATDSFETTSATDKKDVKKDQPDQAVTKPVSALPEVPQRIFILKRLPDGKVSKIETQSKNVVVKINQIVNKDFPRIQLFVSVTNIDGEPVELANTDVIFLEENDKLVPRSNIMSIRQQKHSEIKTPLNMVLAIDKSGSMAFDGTEKMTNVADQPITFAKQAAIEFIKKIGDNDTVQVIAFDGDIHFLDENKYSIKPIERLEANGFTALYAALYYGINKLKGLGGIKGVILMTDGKNDLRAGNPALRQFSLDSGLSLARELNIPVFTIGFGKGADGKTLKLIAEDTHSIYFSTEKKEELSYLYEGIRHIINNQYVITYKTQNFDKSTRVKVRIFSDSDIRTYLNPDELLVKAEEVKKRLALLEQREKELADIKKELEQKEQEFAQKLSQLDSKEKGYQEKIAALEKEQKGLSDQKAKFEELLQEHKKRMAASEKELNLLSLELEKRKKYVDQAMAELQNKRVSVDSQQKNLHSKEQKLDNFAEQLTIKDKKLNSSQKELSIKEVTLEKEKVQIENETSRLNELKTTLNSEKRMLESEKAALINARNALLSAKEDLRKKQDEFKNIQVAFEQEKTNFEKLKQDFQNEKNRIMAMEKSFTDREKALKEEQEEVKQEKDKLNSEAQKLAILKNDLMKEQASLDKQQTAFDTNKNAFDQEKQAFLTEQKQFQQNKTAYDTEKANFDQEKKLFLEEKQRILAMKKEVELDKTKLQAYFDILKSFVSETKDKLTSIEKK